MHKCHEPQESNKAVNFNGLVGYVECSTIVSGGLTMLRYIANGKRSD